MEKFLIVGLGNIGPLYAFTRHNIGFDVADAFVRKHNAFFKNDRLADVAEVNFKGKRFIVIKPTTFMNLSGKAVRYWMDREKIDISRILVIVDELALPLNKIRIRASGSPGGHNGLKDISAMLGSDNYPKLRFGIGNDYPKGGQVDFVLGKWRPDEQPLVQLKIQKCVEVIEQFAFVGIEKTMNLFNNIQFEL